MKIGLFIASIVALATTTTLPVFATSTPNLQIQIFPLECHLDTVALGNANMLQLTPENCLPQPPKTPIIVSPPSSQNSFSKGNSSPTYLNPTVYAPESNILEPHLHAPLIVDPSGARGEKTADQIQISTLVTSIILLLIAAIIAVVHAFYTGVIVPFLAEKNTSKPRLPWSKK